MTVKVPTTAASIGNLENLLTAKGALIKKALGTQDISIKTEDGTISSPQFPFMPATDEIKAYTEFIAALCRMSKELKRVSATEHTVENEKYALRCFLLRLGFIGDEYKTTRRILLRTFLGIPLGGTAHRRRRPQLMIKKKQVQALRFRYSVGTRIELLHMDDAAAPPVGTKGTVTGVDDIGDILVDCDNGSSLNVVP